MDHGLSRSDLAEIMCDDEGLNLAAG